MRGPGVAGLLLSGALAVPALAQTVDLRVREEADSAAVVGAIVRLTASTGTPARGLTNDVGRVVLRAPGTGSYRIRIDRIGFAGFTTDAFLLDSGETRRMMVDVPSRRIQLPTVVTRGRSRCDPKAQDGVLAAALWEEVQKALTANVITQSDSLVPLHLREFVRELDREQRPLRTWVEVSRIMRGAPFGSQPPALLARRGFVREVGEEMEFAGPDAALLLSDDFVETHCFHAVPGANNDLVGLGFRPVSGRRVPEVEGTLWVDRGTSELRFLEYTYTGLPRMLRNVKLGGRVEFSRLPAGGWIVSYWHIRMPRVRADTVLVAPPERDVVDLAGYRDRGGRAEVAGDTTGLLHRAIVRGRVYDSVGRRGLEGALVWVNGTADTMPTASDGRFDLVVDASGDQTVSVRHPRLGLLGEPTRSQLLLSLGDTSVVEFGVPAMETFVSSFCRNSNPPGTASILGVATTADGAPATDWEVRIMRRTGSGKDSVGSNAATGNRRNDVNYSIGVRPVRPRPNGLYGMCGVPMRDTVQLIGAIGRLIQVELTIPLIDGSRWVDLREWGSIDTVRTQISTPPSGAR
jgi:hypothetical protein